MFTNIEPDYTFKWTPLKAQVLADVDEEVPENSTDYTEIFSYFSGKEPMIFK